MFLNERDKRAGEQSAMKSPKFQVRSLSCYRMIVVVLFVSSIILLSLTQKFKTSEDMEFSADDEDLNHASAIPSRSTDLARAEHLPEQDPNFPFPNPHARYVVAVGRRSSQELVSSRNQKEVDSPKIVLWNGQEHSMNDVKKDFEFVLSMKCGGCQVTRNRAAVEESVAVVFFNDIGLFKGSPPDQRRRKSEQAYVFWSRETPAKTVGHRSKLEHSAFDRIFNLTLFFRRDADVIQYFGNRESALRLSKSMDRKLGRKKFLESKTKDVLWLVSNCDHTYGAIQRLIYAKRLVEEGLKLDKFGKCFSGTKRFDAKSIDETQYRFYLSFENSMHCADYISEKFWRNSLQSGLVPIVFGPVKEDIAAIAPHNSFIFAEDFNSPRALVKYINYLSRNKTAYMEYHRWRDQDVDKSIPEEDIAKGPQAAFCRLCKRQVLQSPPRKSIHSIAKWMYDKKYIDGECYQHKPNEADLRKFGSLESLTTF